MSSLRLCTLCDEVATTILARANRKTFTVLEWLCSLEASNLAKDRLCYAFGKVGWMVDWSNYVIVQKGRV